MWIFLVFSGALSNGFINLDTRQYVVENAHIRSFQWENIRWMFTAAYSSNWHPLTWLSHALDYALYGLDPRGHHFTNVALHALNSAGVFVLLFLLFRREHKLREVSLLGAAFAALLFGVHPQRVESVVWVAERKDVLCQFFSTITLICYTLAAQEPAARTRWRWLLGAIAAFALALLAKPMAVTLPVLLLILDVYPLRRITVSSGFRIQSSIRSCMKILAEKSPFAALSAASICLTLWAQHQSASVASLALIGVPARILNAAMAILLYLSKFLVPVKLCPFYPLFPLSELKNPLGFLITLIAVFGIGFHAIRNWRRGREYWLAAWVWFLVALGPVLGFVFIGKAGAADRYTYMASIPYCTIVGFTMVGWLKRSYRNYTKAAHALILSAIVLILGGLSWATKSQVKVWKSDLSLWEASVNACPQSYISYFYLGLAYKEQGNHLNAIQAFEHALTIELPELQQWKIYQYQHEEQLSTYALIYDQLADSYIATQDAANAIRILRIIIDKQIEVNHPRAWLHYRLAHLYFIRRDYNNAARELDQVDALDPGFGDPNRIRAAISPYSR